jgi:hypothetical protein
MLKYVILATFCAVLFYSCNSKMPTINDQSHPATSARTQNEGYYLDHLDITQPVTKIPHIAFWVLTNQTISATFTTSPHKPTCVVLFQARDRLTSTNLPTTTINRLVMCDASDDYRGSDPRVSYSNTGTARYVHVIVFANTVNSGGGTVPGTLTVTVGSNVYTYNLTAGGYPIWYPLTMTPLYYQFYQISNENTNGDPELFVFDWTGPIFKYFQTGGGYQNDNLGGGKQTKYWGQTTTDYQKYAFLGVKGTEARIVHNLLVTPEPNFSAAKLILMGCDMNSTAGTQARVVSFSVRQNSDTRYPVDSWAHLNTSADFSTEAIYKNDCYLCHLNHRP